MLTAAYHPGTDVTMTSACTQTGFETMINKEAVSMPWARLDDMLPVHPKIRALTDSAFRLYISAICWSNLHQTDGYIPFNQLRFVSDVRRAQTCVEQLVEAALWEAADGGWRIHDYLEYQPSAEKVQQEREAKRQRQERWRSKRDASHDPPVDASHDASSRARTHPIPSHSGSVGIQPADRNGDAPDDEMISGKTSATLTHAQRLQAIRSAPPAETVLTAIQLAIKERTGRVITEGQANAIATQILGSETVRNPVAYVTAAINRDPNPRRFLPAHHPSERSLTEASLAAGVKPDNRPSDPETIAAIAAKARKALADRTTEKS